MFATLGGALPWPEGTTDVDDAVRAAVAAQELAGLEPLTDGGLRWADPMVGIAEGLERIVVADDGTMAAEAEPFWVRPITVGAWRFVAALTGRAVKQALPGPYTLARRVHAGAMNRERVTLALGEALREELLALAEAGCPLIEVVEDGAVELGDDAAERALFHDVHRRLTDGVEGVHLSLAIRGGSADRAGAVTIFDAPYRSYLFDLIAGPDNWRLVSQAPGDRGIVCGAADASTGRRDRTEVLVWAAHYAASTGSRGLERVGLATNGSLAGLTWQGAVAKLTALGRAASVAAASSADEVAGALDPRAVDIRSAALGRYVPRSGPRRDRRG